MSHHQNFSGLPTPFFFLHNIEQRTKDNVPNKKRSYEVVSYGTIHEVWKSSDGTEKAADNLGCNANLADSAMVVGNAMIDPT